jgi:hypothetical protein
MGVGSQPQRVSFLDDMLDVVRDVVGFRLEHLLECHQSALAMDAGARPCLAAEAAKHTGQLRAHRFEQLQLFLEVVFVVFKRLCESGLSR